MSELTKNTKVQRRLDRLLNENEGYFTENFFRKIRLVNVKLNDELLRKCNRLSYEKNVSLSTIIRGLILLGMQEELSFMRD